MELHRAFTHLTGRILPLSATSSCKVLLLQIFLRLEPAGAYGHMPLYVGPVVVNLNSYARTQIAFRSWQR